MYLPYFDVDSNKLENKLVETWDFNIVDIGNMKEALLTF